MKKYIVLLLLISCAACKKGDTGTPGNANVKQYTFGPHDFTVTPQVSFRFTTTKDSSESFAWFIYMNTDGGLTYAAPGYGGGSRSYYRIVSAYDNGTGKFGITVARYIGSGDLFQSFRVVRIYINETVVGDGRRASPLPDIDFSDYATVKKYYNLPD